MRTLFLSLLVSIIGLAVNSGMVIAPPLFQQVNRWQRVEESSHPRITDRTACCSVSWPVSTSAASVWKDSSAIDDRAKYNAEITGSQVPSVVRPPMDIAIVIDTSGRMSGDKIRDEKAAAIRMIRSLNKDDRVTLISYASSVRRHETHVLANEEGQATLESHIIGLRSSGSTALGPALFDAFDAFESGQTSVSRLSHVILLSEVWRMLVKQTGCLAARCGQAFRQGISVSTMGVGLNYNEDLMTKIADNGGGRYHFIKESSAIAGVLSDEFKGLWPQLLKSSAQD